MRNPKPIQPGDTIAIVSPASPIEKEKLDKGLQPLMDRGYRVVLMPHVLDTDYHLAGRDVDRASDLRDAFLDPTIDAVVCSRGGYGCARLMQYLDFQKLAKTDKIFAGFSDITTLHLALNHCGLATLYSPMPLSFSIDRDPWVLQSMMQWIEGKIPDANAEWHGETVVAGQAEGEVTGGCLCLICDSIHTEFPIESGGKILVIEDVDEAPHRIDAMLTHLLNAGIIQRSAGIVIGEMTRTDERQESGIGGPPWMEIVLERIKPLNIPAIVGYPFGHCQNMLSLPLGIRASLDASKGTLSYLEPLCR